MTKCGVQPFFQNFTIGKDGYTLYPFSPCYWKGGIVLFNTRLYEHRNNEWQELQSTQFAQAVHMNLDFKYFTDKTSSLAGELFESNPTQLFNLLSEVTALLDENEAESIGDLFHRTTVEPTKTSLNSISSTFKTTLLTMVVTGLTVSIGVVILKYTPLMICLYGILRRNR